MKNAYASGEFHLSEKGNEVWLQALRIYAANKTHPEAALAMDVPLFTPAPTEAPAPEPSPTRTPLPQLSPETSPGPEGGSEAADAP